MPTPRELEDRFWTALRSDMTVMLGLPSVEAGHCRPMTAQFADNENRGPIWFFTSKETGIAQTLTTGGRAIATFASKNHGLFATLHGDIVIDNDRAVIDKLWNRYVAAWFEGGKDDPKLLLLRFDPERAEIWLDASSVMAGIKLFFGADPKDEYKDNVAKVALK